MFPTQHAGIHPNIIFVQITIMLDEISKTQKLSSNLCIIIILL